MKIVTAQQMRELDRRTIQEAGVSGTTLMERAGVGVVAALEDTWDSTSGKIITIVCGKGNNGGDGFVIARLLKRKRAKVTVCLLASPRDLKGDAKIMYQRFVKTAGNSAVQSKPSESKIRNLVSRSDLLVADFRFRRLDRRTIQEAGVSGTTLMERAGVGVVAALEDTWDSTSGKIITIVCGKGNNGGDGFVIARLLKRKRAKVTVCLLASPRDLKGDAKIMYQRFVKTAGNSAVQSKPSESKIRNLVSRSDLLVDALLGTGISSPVTDHYQMAIEIMNGSMCPIIAVDLPSGIHTDSGMVLGTAVKAHLTVSFEYPKIGAFLGSAYDYVGKLRL